MKEGRNKLPQWLSRLLESDQRARLVVALGLAGMALVLVSGLWDNAQTAKPSPASAENDTAQYTATLEHRLSDLLTATDGVGRVNVMVTLERSGETLYAKDQSRESDSVTTFADGNPAQAQQKEDVQESYIMVDSTNGRRQALPLTQLEPAVKGVVVVCAGARDPVVRERVTAVVTTALGVRSIQVCVVPSAL